MKDELFKRKLGSISALNKAFFTLREYFSRFDSNTSASTLGEKSEIETKCLINK